MKINKIEIYDVYNLAIGQTNFTHELAHTKNILINNSLYLYNYYSRPFGRFSKQTRNANRKT